MAKDKGNFRKINLKKKTFAPKGIKKSSGKFGKKRWFKKGETKKRGNCCYLCGGEGHWASDCPHTNALNNDAFDFTAIPEEELGDFMVKDTKTDDPK